MGKTYEDSSYKHWNNNATNDNGDKNEEVRQMNIKDKSSGDHTFYSPSSGAQGIAFGDYRPGRDK